MLGSAGAGWVESSGMSIPDAPPPLAYAVPAEDPHAVTRARRMLGGFTLAYAAVTVAYTAAVFLLQVGVVPSSISFAGGSPLQWGSQIVQTAIMVVMAAAAATILAGSSRGMMSLRYAAGAAAVAGALMQFYWRIAYPGGGTNPDKAGDWLFMVMGIASSAFSIPALICAMTFPLRKPGMRRSVQPGRSISKSSAAWR
jgi:hypothetical protein